MVEPDQSIWRQTLASVRFHRPELCRQWFDDIELLRIDRGMMHLQVREPVRRSYLERTCAEAFVDAAQAVTGRLLTVRFHELAQAALQSADLVAEYKPNTTSSAPASSWSGEELAFSPDNTFEHFVTGPHSRLAHAAALAIGCSPGKAYNPMFVHGDVGLGKTHLLQAICQRILQSDPAASVLYISCEAFITRFMDAVQAGEMASFRHLFRDVDVLLIDDIHFLAKRDRTQDEFFHTFNSLYQRNKQIVLSSDAPPDLIPHLEKRLVSRFKCGLVAEIDRPDYETRIEIIKQKALIRGARLPNDVACLIGSRFNANIRELEGALTKIQITAQLASSPITIEIARKALGVEAPGSSCSSVSIQTIVDAVTAFYDISLSSLQSKRRQRSIALPRQVCMYLARKNTRYSLEEIGGYFGGRDHTTVLHAVRTITNQRDAGSEMDRNLSSLEQQILMAPAV